MVIGLPRSRTTWMANWLTTTDTLCLHDPLANYTIIPYRFSDFCDFTILILGRLSLASPTEQGVYQFIITTFIWYLFCFI